MKKFTLIAALMAGFCGSSFADDSINPWKHCGIGAAIFDDNGTAAAISNVIWDLGTTALSSKISSADSCNGKRTKVAMFIQDNFDVVMEQTSAGEGSHLTAMLDMLDVSADARNAVVANVRSAMAADVNAAPEAYFNALVAAN